MGRVRGHGRRGGERRGKWKGGVIASRKPQTCDSSDGSHALGFLSAYSCLRLGQCDVLELPQDAAEDPVVSLSRSLSVAEDRTSIFGRARLGRGRIGRAWSVI